MIVVATINIVGALSLILDVKGVGSFGALCTSFESGGQIKYTATNKMNEKLCSNIKYCQLNVVEFNKSLPTKPNKKADLDNGKYRANRQPAAL